MVLHETKELKTKNSSFPVQVSNDLTVQVYPNQEHEFLMNSNQAALGFGTTEYVIRRHKLEKSAELIEGKHFVKGVSFSHTLVNAQPHQIFWTKRGIVRLGFFIKSSRAKLFRDWAEDVILENLQPKNLLGESLKVNELPKSRKHNRLTAERMLDIMHDVVKIEDAELRSRIAAKLKGGKDA